MMTIHHDRKKHRHVYDAEEMALVERRCLERQAHTKGPRGVRSKKHDPHHSELEIEMAGYMLNECLAWECNVVFDWQEFLNRLQGPGYTIIAPNGIPVLGRSTFYKTGGFLIQGHNRINWLVGVLAIFEERHVIKFVKWTTRELFDEVSETYSPADGSRIIRPQSKMLKLRYLWDKDGHMLWPQMQMGLGFNGRLANGRHTERSDSS
jgi:hypothetical protein